MHYLNLELAIKKFYNSEYLEEHFYAGLAETWPATF